MDDASTTTTFYCLMKMQAQASQTIANTPKKTPKQFALSCRGPLYLSFFPPFK